MPLKNKAKDIKDFDNVISDSGPEKLQQSLLSTTLDISHILGSRDSVYSHVCQHDTLFQVDVYSSLKTYDLHLWTVRESDDDEINYCLSMPWLQKNCLDSILSDTFRCILPGMDGTFDMYLADSINQPWIDWVKDTVVYPGTKVMKVLAGSDRKCDSDIMKPSNVENAASYNIIDLISNTNEILNRGGIQMNLVDHGQVLYNFDIINDDNMADKTEGLAALDELLFLTQTSGMVIPVGSPKVVVFPDLKEPLGETLNGTSRSRGKKTIIDGNRMYERTLAHELGHAIWGLQHPDEQDSDNNPIGEDGLLNVVTDDPENLMTSGSKSSASSNIYANNSFLRRYVWKRMQEED